MLFNSFEFLVFLPVVVILYFILPHKFRWVLLLIASYYFYMAWNAKYIILIIASTLVDYFASLQMEKQETRSKRRVFLILSLLSNLGLLFVFKYFNFFNDAFGQLYNIVFTNDYSISSLNILLPMGISFYTFQTLSYTIDVYRGSRKAEHHLGYFALYVSFFPQLVAGPIERSDRLLPQLKEKQTLDYNRMVAALLRIAWGFFKKVVIADRVAIIVNTIYGDLGSYSGVFLIAATIGFSIQIYCDFSAYSDIAIGCAKLMGYDLMENFKMPYFAKSIGEFWQRWHISLSTWFRDYLYIPLGGSRNKKKWMVFRNIMIVFVVSGLWHGANWTFLIWGFLHGLYLVTERVVEKIKENNSGSLLNKIKIPTVIKQIFTAVLVLIGWVFFRANNIKDAFYIFKNLSFKNIKDLVGPKIVGLGLDKFDISILVLCVAWLFVVDGYKYYAKKDKLINGDIKQGIAAILLVLFIIVFGYYGYYNPVDFIYFQF